MTALPTPDSFSLELSSIWTSKRNFKRNSLICKCGKDLSLGRGASQSVITDKILASTKAKTRSTLPRIKSLWIRGLLLSVRTCTNYVRINTVSGKLANFWTQHSSYWRNVCMVLNMTMVISKHFGTLIFMESFA